MIVPTLIPKKLGERIKTDCRDSIKLAGQTSKNTRSKKCISNGYKVREKFLDVGEIRFKGQPEVFEL